MELPAATVSTTCVNYASPNKLNKVKNKASDSSGPSVEKNPTSYDESHLYENMSSDVEPTCSTLIPVDDFEKYVHLATASRVLEKQQQLVPRGQTKPWDYAMNKANKSKNRYANLAAYNYNRVKLKKLAGDPYSDYINASYIDGYKKARAYIATQGPTRSTVNDFWRMIWQERVAQIVMLANLIEADKKKCELYWPKDEQTQQFGDMRVAHIKSEIYADFVFRLLQVQYKGKGCRHVEHLHYTSWPDHGVPIYPQSLVPFLSRIHGENYGNAPIVVHCSAGVGRTGSIILYDLCLRMASAEGAVDVLRYLSQLREQRINMVDNYAQYRFVHLLLLEYMLAPDVISCVNFSQTLKDISSDGTMDSLMQYMQRTRWQDEKCNNEQESSSRNDSKNRVETITPHSARIYICVDENATPGSDYINAVPVDGFRFKNQFIVTQLPLPGTVGDFWAMLHERDVQLAVVLNDIPVADKTCCPFYPTDARQMSTARGITIKHVSTKLCELYSVINLQYSMTDEESRAAQILQLHGWSHGQSFPPSAAQLVTVCEAMDRLARGSHPVAVLCYDGATSCGLFLAASFVIEKVKLEQQVDACLAVRVTRRNRPQLCTSREQFKYLFRAAEEYLKLFETYSNFKEPTKQK